MAKETLEPGEVEALLNELETKMGRLRALYEQYFQGIERRPPHVVRKDVVRLVFRIENLYIRNTALKFRSRSLIQRFNSFKTYWTRVERQIEEGTYARDIRRAERNRDRRDRREERRHEDAQDNVVELDLDDGVIDLRDLEIELEALDAEGAFDRPAPAPSQPSPQPTTEPADLTARKRAKLAQIANVLGIQDVSGAPPAQPTARATESHPAEATAKRDKLAEIKRRMQQRGAVSDAPAERPTPAPARPAASTDDARRVYDQLIEAKRRCNESTDNISYESVARSIERQRAKIKETRGSDVDFKVVIKDGRAFIKPETK